MRKYIEPEINICKFSAEDIITTSALSTSSAEGYVSANEAVAIRQSAAYIIDWDKE